MPVLLKKPPPSVRAAYARAVARGVQAGAAAFLVSVVVEVFIAPLQIHHFGRVSVVGPLATVVFLAPVTLLQGLALAASLDLSVPAGPIGAVLALASSATREGIALAGAVAPDPVVLPNPVPVLYYGGVAMVCSCPRRWVAWVVGASCVILSFLVG
jgi:hypothetical protein